MIMINSQHLRSPRRSLADRTLPALSLVQQLVLPRSQPIHRLDALVVAAGFALLGHRTVVGGAAGAGMWCRPRLRQGGVAVDAGLLLTGHVPTVAGDMLIT
jgi:hypothetical protein